MVYALSGTVAPAIQAPHYGAPECAWHMVERWAQGWDGGAPRRGTLTGGAENGTIPFVPRTVIPSSANRLSDACHPLKFAIRTNLRPSHCIKRILAALRGDL